MWSAKLQPPPRSQAKPTRRLDYRYRGATALSWSWMAPRHTASPSAAPLGEAHDNRLCAVLLSALLSQTMLLADRGYDADWIREFVRQQGAWANVPLKLNRKGPVCFSPYLCRARNLIERFFNKIKQCRRVATRYDTLAANDLAYVKLASIRIWLFANESALSSWVSGALPSSFEPSSSLSIALVPRNLANCRDRLCSGAFQSPQRASRGP